MATAYCAAVRGICVRKNKHFTKSNCSKCKRYASKNNISKYKQIFFNE
jgi:hypothetical protein